MNLTADASLPRLWAFLNFTCACAMQIRWSTPSLPSRKLYAV